MSDDQNKHNLTCSTCRWHWTPAGKEWHMNYMACRRFAPQLTAGHPNNWPITAMDDFCGEWESVEENNKLP